MDNKEVILDEGTYSIYIDKTFRRRTKNIIITSLPTITPRWQVRTLLKPSTLAVGNITFTWQEVQEFFMFNPLSRNRQLPMHYYAEYFDDDYNIYVGLPFSNTSWVLEKLIDLGMLSSAFRESILIVLQEDYSKEPLDDRLMDLLAHQLITPLLKEYKLSRYNNIHFLENLLDGQIIKELNQNTKISDKYPFYYREPVFLDEVQLEKRIKKYSK